MPATRLGVGCAAALLLSVATATAETCIKTQPGAAPPTETHGGICQSYAVKTAGDSTACHWEFDYRSPAAVALAEKIWANVRSCDAGREQDADQIVNHPDSYVPRTWITDSAAKTVSVKDKAALNKTLVFLRVEPLP